MASSKLRQWISSDLGLLLLLALGRIALHTLVNNHYGFHRDELLTFDNARHLAWGYVVYRPVTPFLARIELELFGNSLRGFRFFAASSLCRSDLRIFAFFRLLPFLQHLRLSLVAAGGLFCGSPPQIG